MFAITSFFFLFLLVSEDVVTGKGFFKSTK
jgi:hypothetical protein